MSITERVTANAGVSCNEKRRNSSSFAVGAKRAQTRRKKYHGFTLVELLVVIGILSILAGLLLPVLRQAREIALEVTCISNERQMFSGFTAYMDDWSGYLPGGAMMPPYNNIFRWLTTNDKGGTYLVDLTEANGYLYSDTKNRGKGTILDCPSLMTGMPKNDGVTLYTLRPYDYSFDKIPVPGKNLATDIAVKPYTMKVSPSKQAMLIDLANESAFFTYWFAADLSRFISPHLGGNNTLYYDGHVKSVMMWELVSYAAPNNIFFYEKY